MDKVKTILYMIMNSVYIPEHVINRKEKIILHISDTPACFFRPLKKLIKKINPEYIIHTGDMVDDLKLECYPKLLSEYRENLKVLLEILENSSAEKIYLALGNHDHKDTVQKIARRCIVIDECESFKIENMDVRVSHYSEEILKNPSKINLYGHNIRLESKKENGRIYLNGIMNINIISIPEGKIFEFPYPFGTDDIRLKKGKIGL